MTHSYGDVTTEYLALRRGVGIVEAHELVWVTGPDAARFLDGLVSQSVNPMAPGDIAPSLLLSPQGKLRAPHWILYGGDQVGLLTDIGSAAIVEEDLNRFKIRVDVAITSSSEPVLDLWGPAASDVLAKLGIDLEHGWVQHETGLAAMIPFRSGGSLPRYVLTGLAPEELAEAGAVRAGTVAATAVRIEQGEPVNGTDIDEKTIPEEAGLVAGAVDFDKGCYLGQELTARIDSRGHVNRHLRGVEVTTNVVPPVGATVQLDGSAVGELSSVGESLDLRAPVALSLLRREAAVDDPVTIAWDGGTAPGVVRALPMV